MTTSFRFHYHGRAYWLVPPESAAGPAASAARLRPDEAARLVRCHMFCEADTMRLRALVGARHHGVPHWSDHEVRAEAVRLVAGGAWMVWSGAADPQSARARGAAAASSGSRAASGTAASAPRPAARPAAPAPVAAATAAAPDWTTQVRQDAFAAVLEDAARAAVPFCEICA